MALVEPTDPGRSLRILVIVAAILALLSVAARLDRSGIFIPHWSLTDLSNLRHESGWASVAPTHRVELSSHQVPSLAQVWEDGRPLAGPANAAHDEIRELGRGRYSFWHAYVYFSASDHSDPGSNGRHYQIYYPWMVDTRIAFSLYGLTALFLGLAARFAARHRRLPEVVALAAWSRRFGRTLLRPSFRFSAWLLGLVFLVARAGFFVSYPVVGLAPDTASYAALADVIRAGTWPHFIIRTPGYPLLIWLTTLVSDRWMTVIVVQCLLSLAGALGLVYAVSRLSRTLLLPATLAMTAFLGSSQVLIYDTVALSDSFYTSCVLLSAAFLLLALAEDRVRDFILASGFMGTAILIRPAGMYFIVIYALVLGHLLWRRHPWKMRAAFVLPLPALLALLCTYNYVTIGAFVISPFGEANLVGATVLYWAPDPALPPEINHALQALPASYAHAGISPADLGTIRSSWNPAQLYEIYSRSYNVMIHGEGWGLGNRFGAGDYLANRRAMRQVSLLAIRRHPTLYFKFVLANMISFFQGTKYRFDFDSIVVARAKQHFVSADRGYDLATAKEYRSAHPPPAVQLVDTAEGRQIVLTSTAFGRMQVDWQFWDQLIFQRLCWAWGYFLVLFLSGLQLIRHRGDHFGAFLLLLLTLIAFGASTVICLVEESMDRYSYPTQFIYYLAVALCPLLWTMKQRPPRSRALPAPAGSQVHSS